jgi:hypothetical protein
MDGHYYSKKCLKTKGQYLNQTYIVQLKNHRTRKGHVQWTTQHIIFLLKIAPLLRGARRFPKELSIVVILQSFDHE